MGKVHCGPRDFDYLCGWLTHEDMNPVLDHKQAIAALCRKHKVSRMFVFGSALTPRFTDESDVDLLVTFDASAVTDYFDNFFELKYSLQDLLGREVDLLEEKTIRNPYLRKGVDAHKMQIYG